MEIRDQLQLIYSAERERLQTLTCDCKNGGEYRSPVFGDGDPKSGILFVGEAPGAEETQAGRPFVGRAGKHLNSLLNVMGLSREDVYMTNVVKFRPVTFTKKGMKNRTPGNREIIDASICLEREIAELKPRLIVTLGNTPLRAVFRLSGVLPPNIGDTHGKSLKLLIGRVECELYPLYHPASGIYNRSLLPIMQEDARKLGEHLVKLL